MFLLCRNKMETGAKAECWISPTQMQPGLSVLADEGHAQIKLFKTTGQNSDVIYVIFAALKVLHLV